VNEQVLWKGKELQLPLKPSKSESASWVAVKVTWVPGVKDAVQVLPQLMPLGLEVTDPVPSPASVSVSVT